MSESKTSQNNAAAIGEDKLFGLLLLGLGAVLLIALLVWRVVDKEADTELAPTADEKHAIWFDENGVVRKTKSAPAETKKQPALVDLQKQAPAPQKAVASNKAAPNYWIQLASFSQRANAVALRDKVSAGSATVEVAENQRGDQQIYAVRVLVFGDRAEADALSERIGKRYGLKPLVMKAN